MCTLEHLVNVPGAKVEHHDINDVDNSYEFEGQLSSIGLSLNAVNYTSMSQHEPLLEIGIYDGDLSFYLTTPYSSFDIRKHHLLMGRWVRAKQRLEHTPNGTVIHADLETIDAEKKITIKSLFSYSEIPHS
jgi:hypothetical protein